MRKKTPSTIDLDKLTPEERSRIERVLNPRKTVLGLRFAEASIASWRSAAEQADQTLTDWIERALNAAAGKRR